MRNIAQAAVWPLTIYLYIAVLAHLFRIGLGRKNANMCPFLEKADIRCAGHLTLQNLMQAFADCAHYYQACPVFCQLMDEDRQCGHIDASQQSLAVS